MGPFETVKEDVMSYWITIAAIFVVIVFLSGIRVVRPTTRGLVERLGKYRRFANPGFNWVIPTIDKRTGISSETRSF
jgi:regulator of protease activity HflC (stomatin/prohibitin superfamily)